MNEGFDKPNRTTLNSTNFTAEIDQGKQLSTHTIKVHITFASLEDIRKLPPAISTLTLTMSVTKSTIFQ